MKAERKNIGNGSFEEDRTGFRSKSSIVEKITHMRPDLDTLRKMIMRDEIDSLVKLTTDQDHQALIATLLTDNYLAIGPTAADVLRLAALEGIDIEQSVPALKEALKDRYTKINASAALAVYYQIRDDKVGLLGLLSHEDIIIRNAAKDIVVNQVD